jgi:hypothetical protein
MSDTALERLIGVYDADGSVVGELSYFVRARFGRAHCALCDITHGRVRERADWRTSRDRLPVPFVTFHRDDQPDEVRLAASAGLPVVLGESGDGTLAVLAGPEVLESCAGSPEELMARLDAALATQGWSWPT